MITTFYNCDWCKLPMPQERAFKLSVDPAELLKEYRIEQEICDACCTKLERWIESQERGDEGGAGVPLLTESAVTCPPYRSVVMIETGGMVCLIIIICRILFNLIDSGGPPLPRIKPHNDYR